MNLDQICENLNARAADGILTRRARWGENATDSDQYRLIKPVAQGGSAVDRPDVLAWDENHVIVIGWRWDSNRYSKVSREAFELEVISEYELSF